MTRRQTSSRLQRFALRPLSLAVWLAVDANLVWALPTDPSVVAGQVSIQQPSVGSMVVNQGSDKAIINWRGFSIDVNETVRFVQPTSQSAILNRVTGFDPSRILGQMQSNGRVFLVNPNGIVFGETARVDVGSLVASTLNLSDQDFMAGRYLFAADVSLGDDRQGRGPLAGKVINEGRIRATNGDVVLLGREVVNSGQIIAEQGRVGLAAASKLLVDVEGDGLLFFEMEGKDANARLDQLGEVKAVGGSVELMASARAKFADTVLNMSGVVQSRGLGKQGGRIVIDGGGSGLTKVSGTLDVAGLNEGQTGGSVAVLGDRVALMNGARIDARGDSGGGVVNVGGDFQGQGPARRSSVTYVAPQASIDASATRTGNGGQVVIWSDGITAYHGSILARGGVLGGNGGVAEVSGKGHLDFLGQVDLSAALGQRGHLLLDPLDLEIGTVDDLNGDATAGDDITANILDTDGPAAGTSKITATKLVLLMNSQDVTLAATNDITVKSAVNASGNANSHSLSLTAGNAIDVQQSLTTKNGAVALTSGTGGITQATGTTINAGNATVTLDGNGHDVTLSGAVTTTNGTASAIAINHANNLSVGALTSGAAGTITLDVAGTGVQTGAISGGQLAKTGAGTLTLSQANSQGSTSVSAGTLSISNDNQLGTVPATATPGNLALSGGTLGTGANLTINSKRGISLNGGGTIDVANTKTLTYNGIIAGSGGLTKTGAGELALGGANTHAGDTTISAGKLTADAGSLSANSGVVIGAAGTLALAGNNTAASVTLNGGDITGTGRTLTAATYELNGGTVSTNLGAGTLTQASGTTTLDTHGTSAAGTVNITGGTLALGDDGRLANTAAVTVSAGATLNLGLGHNETVGSLVSSGTIAGTGTSKLTAATYQINQGTVDAKLGAGTFTKATAGVATVNGTLDATTVNVDAGTMTLGAFGRLDSGATVNVTGTLNLAGVEFVNTLNLSGGTLGGAGHTMNVSAAVGLQAGTLDANLAGLAAVTKTTAGTVTVNGTIANPVVNVNAGLLALGAANRLANTAAVSVNGGRLDLGGFSDTVGAVTLQSGEINNGTLTGSSYAVQSGSIGANLAGVAAGLTKTTAGTVILAGNNTYGTTLISAGALQVGDGGTSGTLGSGAVTNSATLVINRSDAVAVTSSMGGTGALTQEGTGTTTLSGTNTYSGATTVNHGTLATSGANKLSANSALTINNGATVSLAGDSSAGSLTLNGGTLDGVGNKLTAATYGLNGGTVNTKLGAGTLTQASGNTTLNGTVDASTVNVNGGSLTLGAAGLLNSGAALTVANASTLTLGGNETVGSFALNTGTLGGTGTLTAATYALSGGTVNANLGTGTLSQLANTTTLNGTSGAGTVNINGGTLVAGGNDRLASTVNINLNGGTFDLGGFSQTTLGDVVLASGNIIHGLLMANRFDLRSGAISADLGGGAGGGAIKSTAGTVILSGTNSYGDTTINGGTVQVGTGATTGSLGGGLVVNNGTLTIKRSNNVTVSDVSGSGNLVQDGSGTTTLAGTVAYTGNTTVNSGTLSGAIGQGALAVNSGATLSLTSSAAATSVTLNNGTINGTGLSLTAPTYALNGGTVGVDLGAGTVTQGSGNTTVNGVVNAGTVNVTGGTLTLGGNDLLNNSTAVTVSSGATLALGANSDTVGSLVSDGNVSGTGGTLTAGTYTLNAGTVSANLGAGTLTKATAGTVNLSGTTDASAVNVNAGTLTLGSAGRLIGTTTTVQVANATLNLGGNENAFSLSLNNSTLGGTGTLTASTYGLQSATVNANLGAGTLTQSSGTSTLNGTSGATTVNINGGTLALGANDRLSNAASVNVASGSTLAMGTRTDTVASLTSSGNVSGTGTLTAASYNLNAGTVDANLGGGTMNTGGNVTLNGQSGASVVNVNAGTLTLGSSGRLAANAAVTVLGTLALAGNESIASLTLNNGILGGLGHTLTAGSYAFNGGTVDANLGAGSLTQLSNTTTLNGTSQASDVSITGGQLVLGSGDRLSDAAAVQVNSGAQLTLGGAETIGSLAGSGSVAMGANALTTGGNDTSTAFSGNLSGTGTLTKQGSGTLALSGTGITYSGATTVNSGTLSGTVGAGALTVNNGATMALTADTTVASLTLNQGTVSGTGRTLSASGGSYTLNGGTVNANLGTGTLTQAANTTTLNGTSAASTVNITGGTLALGVSNRLNSGAAVTVLSGATLALGANSDTVGSLVSDGNVSGTGGTLTASTYTLNAGTVSANLGTGALTKATVGTVNLSGTTDASVVNVNAGTLTLGSAGRLTGTATVQVANATLNLGGNESASSLSLNNSTLGGTVTLTASTYGLQSATVNANLGAGTLTQSSGTSTLNGTAGAATVNINGGTLALGANDRLSNAASVNVASGSTLAVGTRTDTVGSLTSSGNVSGTGTLTAASYNLNAGTVDANLGGGTMTTAGNVTLNGQSGATIVNVNAGTLTLGSSGRLAANAAVTVLGTLALAGNESIASLTLNNGILGGLGHTLTAGSYAFNGGTVDANLGAGSLTQLSNTTTLNGTSQSNDVSITGGQLVLGSADRLSDTAAVQVASGAQLNLGGAETIGSLAGSGLVAMGANALTTGGNDTSTAFSGNLSGTGTLTKQGSGTLALSGTGITYSGATTINSGTLSGPVGAGALTVNNGATMALTADTTVASLTLNQGTVSGAGRTLSASGGSYTLNGGTVNANLGTGALTQAANTTTLNGTSGASTVNVTGGTLTLGGAERLANTAAVTLSSGTQLNLGGAQTVGSLAGAGDVALGASTVTTGGNNASTTYSGIISGTGGLSKQGSGIFTLEGNNAYAGSTTIASGTLQVGNAGTSGTLGSGDVINDAALVFNRSDNHTVANNISGAGSVTQAGSQTLTLSGTTNIGGAFVGSGHWHILNTLTAGSLTSTGNATLGANVVTTAGGQTYTGTVTTEGATTLTAAGDIIASNTGNNFSAGKLSIQANTATIEAGTDQSLHLDAVTLATGDSNIHADEQIFLEGAVSLTGGTLTLTADHVPAPVAIGDPDFPRTYNFDGPTIGRGSAAIAQTGGTVTTAAGTTLSLKAPGRGSILLDKPDNQIEGQIVAVSGPSGDTNQARFRSTNELGKLSFVRINSTQINSAGIEGDVVKLSANSMTTPTGVVRARLPYNNLQGTLTSLPALTFVLKQPGNVNQFGLPGNPANWLQVSVGNGTGGYLTIRPQNHGLSATAVWLAGAEPPTPFYDGAGKLTQIPVYYNGKAPSTPQAEGALSAVTTVIEDARRARFDEAVRTENVSSRLRTGVIAEVGAGRPATEGGDSIRLPESCAPQAGTLACAP